MSETVDRALYHRELKQTCGIERCQARTGRAQRNHIRPPSSEVQHYSILSRHQIL
ncbi:hypothetical protein [Piscirickettsia salmonis]|uniref:hypothetical protein n=1 Tax=Piscirickettsia salmonis TaxID=1238 RepID=UPI0012B86892|nr:hypothetical protein [Piscirickettsia salmonis]